MVNLEALTAQIHIQCDRDEPTSHLRDPQSVSRFPQGRAHLTSALTLKKRSRLIRSRVMDAN